MIQSLHYKIEILEGPGKPFIYAVKSSSSGLIIRRVLLPRSPLDDSVTALIEAILEFESDREFDDEVDLEEEISVLIELLWKTNTIVTGS